MSNSARRREISCLNVAFCIMVILLHLLSNPVTGLVPGSWQHALAYVPWKLFSVAVYGFIFLSGVKLFLPSARPFRLADFYRRRAKTILLPYLIAVTVYALVFAAVYRYRYDLATLLRYYLLGRAASHFYFVVIIIQFYALMPLWRLLLRRVDPVTGIVVMLFFQLLFRELLRVVLSLAAPDYTMIYQDRVFTSYIAVWTCGCYAGSRYEEFLGLLRRNRWLLLVCGLLTALVNTWLSYQAEVKALWTTALSVLGLAYVLFATLALYVLADVWVRRGHGAGKWLDRIDRVTYPVYLYHMLVLLMAGSLMTRLGIQAVSVSFLLRAVITFGVTIPGCLLYQAIKTRIVDRNRQAS